MDYATLRLFGDLPEDRTFSASGILRRRARKLAAGVSALAIAVMDSYRPVILVKTPAAGKTELSIKVTTP